MGIFNKEPNRRNVYDSLKRLATGRQKKRKDYNFEGNFHKILTENGIKVVNDADAPKFMRYYRASMDRGRPHREVKTAPDLVSSVRHLRDHSAAAATPRPSIGTLTPISAAALAAADSQVQHMSAFDEPSLSFSRRPFRSYPRIRGNNYKGKCSDVFHNRHSVDEINQTISTKPLFFTSISISKCVENEEVEIENVSKQEFSPAPLSISDGFASDVFSAQNIRDELLLGDNSDEKVCLELPLSKPVIKVADPDHAEHENEVKMSVGQERAEVGAELRCRFPVPFYLIKGLGNGITSSDCDDLTVSDDGSSFQDYDDIDVLGDSCFRKDDYGNLFHRPPVNSAQEICYGDAQDDLDDLFSELDNLHISKDIEARETLLADDLETASTDSITDPDSDACLNENTYARGAVVDELDPDVSLASPTYVEGTLVDDASCETGSPFWSCSSKDHLPMTNPSHIDQDHVGREPVLAARSCLKLNLVSNNINDKVDKSRKCVKFAPYCSYEARRVKSDLTSYKELCHTGDTSKESRRVNNAQENSSICNEGEFSTCCLRPSNGNTRSSPCAEDTTSVPQFPGLVEDELCQSLSNITSILDRMNSYLKNSEF